MAELPSRFRVVRPDDLLVVEVELVNLQLSADAQRLERADGREPARLILHFPGQHVAEQAYRESEGASEPAGPPPVKALASGPSRLVFTLPEDAPDLPLTMEGLLAWDRLEPSLAANALPPDAVDGPRPAIPAAYETAIEFPYRLLLSPDTNARWTHRTQPFGTASRTEVWHSRLEDVPVRAVGRRPYPDTFLTSLVDRDLNDLVTLTSDFGIAPAGAEAMGLTLRVWRVLLLQAGLLGFHYQPKPIQAERFMLTALGASARLRGVWDYPALDHDPEVLARFKMPVPTLQQYEHIAGLGRDQFVKVVRRGFVSTGHRASIVKITERRFEPKVIRTVQTPQGAYAVFGSTAYLRQYYQIIIQEPELAYGPLAGGYVHQGREMPMRSIRLTTLVTPKIDFPGPKSAAQIEAEVRGTWIPVFAKEEEDRLALEAAIQARIDKEFKKPFWVVVAGRDFEFGAVATDWEGAPASFTTPLVFVPFEAIKDDPSDVIAVFNQGAQTRRTRPFANQDVALADPAGSDPKSTRAPVESITYKLQPVPAAQIASLPRTYRPRWVFSMAGARVHVDAVERVTGSSAAVAIELAGAYLQAAANPAGVFAQLTGGDHAVGFPADRGGGLARPDLSIRMLSSRQGALPATFAKPAVTTADLKALFGKAKLFGSVPLGDLLGEVVGLGAGDFGLSDQALQQRLDTPGQLVRVPVLRTRLLPNAVEARFVWKPPLASRKVGALQFDFGASSSLVLEARLVTPLDGGEARSELRGALSQFDLTFAGVVGVHMDRLAFDSLPGRKPDITAEGFALTFQGPLQFVNTLRDLLPADGFSDPPAVSVSPSGISAGYTLAIPSFGVGIFSLQNLSLSAALAIPFNDQPASFRFAVSERHHPFIVTVSLFGGGGFFALGVSSKGVESIEAAIEFGGNISLNLGVASGGVSVMAGVYFGLTGTTTTLTGYLRVGGHLSVLGLVSISVEFYLAFTYRDKGGGRSEVYGQARVTVSVKVAFISKSVSLSVEKRFAGAAGDPTFDQVVEPPDWEQYCLAFAE